MRSARHRASSRSVRSASTGLATTATTAAQRKRWRTGILSLGAVAALGAGVAVGPSASATNSYTGDFSMDQLDELLNNDMILDYLEVCRNADGSTPVPEEGSEDARPVAVADCSQATGDGIAVVLPDRIELGSAAEDTTIDLGKDINLLGLKYELGERNLFEILSAAALGSDTIKSIVGGLGLPRIDPTQLGKYSTYEQVQADAALPFKAAYRDERGECNKWLWKVCIGWETVKVEYDGNLEKRTNALKIAEYLTGKKYDASKPVELPDMDKNGPRGSATIAGDGISVAAAMRDGNALAEAKKLFGLPAAALAGADNGRSSVAHATLGVSTALNMDTNEIGLTWFGQALDLTRLRHLGVEKYAGEDVMDLLDTAENLDIPKLKEVSCFGISASATAEGLGSCTNILGTFDRYEDLRDPVVGESRQTQWGLTDLSSLVLGNDALVKQLTGDAGSTPFLDDLMTNITSEEGRLRFAKDFVRLTRNVTTEEVEVPVLDDEGNPLLDEDGDAVTEKTTRQTTAAWLTSDYGLREPVTVEWFGHRVVFFPGVDVNGSTRPNLLSLPQIEKIADDADTGLLPKVSLVTWDNAFGLGTVTLDDLTRPDRIFTNWAKSVTLPSDLKWIGDLLGLGKDDESADDAEDGTGTCGTADGTDESGESGDNKDCGEEAAGRSADGSGSASDGSSTSTTPAGQGLDEDDATSRRSGEPTDTTVTRPSAGTTAPAESGGATDPSPGSTAASPTQDDEPTDESGATSGEPVDDPAADTADTADTAATS
ncbi:hypothetical protein ACTXKQ_10020 [Corynebacterium variabile]|uniref:hypothetical protein n=1 Tax=Corynebacterium variabile TaxID=1727 RepID=UPI003F8EB9F4